MPSALPRIAVLIAAYNAEQTIHRALSSLQANTERHDVIIVDDGSRVDLETAIPPQPNLKIIRLAQNVGIAKATNVGLAYILERPYDYIARLDADDAAAPDRLAVQRAFLDENPSVGCVGSWGRFVAENGDIVFYLHPPEDHATLVQKLYYNNCFLHPTLMIRSALLREIGGYDEDYPIALDYEILRRIALHTQTANIPRYLIDYAVSPGGISLSKRRRQLRARLKIQWAYRNWRSIHFYLGIAKTLALNLVPRSVITAIKQHKKDYQVRD